MVGFLVRHPGLGTGRIIEKQPSHIRIRFFDSGQEQTLTRGYHRQLLGLQSRCSAERGHCQVVSRHLGADWQSPHRYEVEFEDGVRGQLSECELSPVDEPANATCSSPLEALLQLRPEGYTTFESREALLDQYLQALRGGLGVRALLSSRIDLMPHQAYVAGVVLLDQRARYILADEVGLGKTIEAGIVLHDLLARKPDARVLVLCPGALTQQWLCEMYAKFCGRVFRLPELVGGLAGERATGNGQVILSFLGGLQRRADLLATPWDLVVVDEAHHLLAAPALYDLAHQLSIAAAGVLLLSALPAQHREEEYLRLLALLEPHRYHPDQPGELARFCELYALQRQLGRELRWVDRRLEDVAAGHRRPEDIIKRLRDLTGAPALAPDHRLRELVAGLDGVLPTFADDVRVVLHHIADHHRINRRILRNRRARLVEDHAVPAIMRSLHRLPYPPAPLESEALEYVRRLLGQIDPAAPALAPLAKLLFQACCDPYCLVETLALAAPARGDALAEGWSTALDGVLGYADHRAQVASLWRAVTDGLDDAALRRTQRAAQAWREDEGSRGRFDELVRFLKAKLRAERQVKLLLFAGAPGLAARLHAGLCAEFPGRRLARFHYGMTDPEKEQQARSFRRDSETFLLITDETGGEGRNFQFADELIHYDTPWHAARVEQRIGRLDRLRRLRLDVVSNVLCAAGSEEEGMVTVFDEGLGVYRASISGLEFALRAVENDLATTAVARGGDGLISAAPAIRERAAAERAEDESADLFDAASIERRAAEGFRHAQSTPEREQSLEMAFNRYFGFIAPGRQAIETVRQPDGGPGVFRYRPEDMRHVALALPPALAAGTLPPPEGTFRRALAQEQPNLQFFSVGNVFFDAVCGSLFTALAGRTYAIETTQGAGEWRGFEFGFRIVPGEELGGEAGLLNQFNRLFAFHTERVWVKENGTPSKMPENLLLVRRRCTRDRKDTLWWNLTKEKADRLDQFYTARGSGWAQTVSECYEVARALVQPRFEEKLASRLGDERGRLREQRRQLDVLQPTGWREEIAALERLDAALGQWTVALDSAGFLSAGKQSILAM